MRQIFRARRAPQPPWSRREQEEKARVFVVVEQIKTIGVCWTIANPAVVRVRLDLPSCCTQYDTLSTASTVRSVDLKIVLRTFIHNLSVLLDS